MAVTEVKAYRGLSTDTKPIFVGAGSSFYETDTDALYIYQVSGNLYTWNLSDSYPTLADDSVDSAEIASGAVDGSHLSGTLEVKIATVHVAHDDASGADDIVLPARSLQLWALAICTESSAGNPDVDFGIEGGNTDSLFDDLGGNCATAGNTLGDDPDATGVGVDLFDSQDTAANQVPKHVWFVSGTTLTNTQNDAGTAGEWDVYVGYTILPAN